MNTNVFETLYQEELYVLPPRTVVLLDRQWAEIDDEEKILLTRILGSVKLTPASVQILTTGNIDIPKLTAFNPARVISFGPAVAGVTGMYQFNQINGIPVICADGLDRLDDPRKKNLWIALRQMFGIQ